MCVCHLLNTDQMLKHLSLNLCVFFSSRNELAWKCSIEKLTTQQSEDWTESEIEKINRDKNTQTRYAFVYIYWNLPTALDDWEGEIDVCTRVHQPRPSKNSKSHTKKRNVRYHKSTHRKHLDFLSPKHTTHTSSLIHSRRKKKWINLKKSGQICSRKHSILHSDFFSVLFFCVRNGFAINEIEANNNHKWMKMRINNGHEQSKTTK